MKKILFLGASIFALTISAIGSIKQPISKELVISADRMAADNVTATVVASGHVHAVAAPLTIEADYAEKRGDNYNFSPDTMVTTCTNDHSSLHWTGSGEIEYYGKEGSRYALARNMTLRLFDIPVMWFPYWYYPLDTDYGWRVMPGYTSKWGVYLLTKYVYHLAGDMSPDGYGLSGSTRFDVRSKNGIALGQGLRWSLDGFGQGQFKVYYAWDQDADRYDHKWSNTRHSNYRNWGSEVPDERYALMLSHKWNPTERDIVRLSASYYSDSYFRGDFLRDGLFGHSNRYNYYDGNELSWEHNEKTFGFGLSVSGPLNDFYSGVARLPEVYFDISPQPVFSLPLNYESSSRMGFLNRNYAKYGSIDTAIPFRYLPGEWADYQTFRLDTYHRLTMPFKVADLISVVPRVGVRGTFYDRVGEENTTGYGRARCVDSDAWRLIYEGGVTFSARGTAEIGDGWNHLLEPYLDILAQEAKYYGLDRGNRPFVFDSHDASSDWLDQFAGRSRNLPYSWYGLTPGIRNALRKADDAGFMRTYFDFDLYAAIQFNDTEWTNGPKTHRLSKHPEDPNYGSTPGRIMPGFRARWLPSKDTAFSVRTEYDTENEKVAYADISWMQAITKDIKFDLAFIHRNHRWWDFAPSPYDPSEMSRDDFNQMHFSYIQLEVEHEITDTFAWGPFISWDVRDGELDEVGTWFDIRTDCLGFRFQMSYESDYERIDRSRSEEDWRFGFYIYLRALGPASGSPF